MDDSATSERGMLLDRDYGPNHKRFFGPNDNHASVLVIVLSVIYVYTSILNGWDNLRPPVIPAFPGVRYLCFTNVPVLPAVPPWEIQVFQPEGDICRAARIHKILPHRMLPSDAEYSIWHDGNLRLTQAPWQAINRLLDSNDWGAHRHPCRNCIYDEAAVLLSEKIGTPDLVRGEIARYETAGHPKQAGLWANGFIVRRHTPAVADLNETWWKLYSDGCERDQLSFPVARRAAGVEVKTIDANIYESPYVGFYWHAAWHDKPSSREFHEERNTIRSRIAELPESERLRLRVSYPEF